MSYSWNKERKPASHTEDWLMTYADLITLLLCFFAIVIITSAAKKNVSSLPPKQEISQQDPVQLEQPPKTLETSTFQSLDVFHSDLPFQDPSPTEAKQTPVEPGEPTTQIILPDNAIVADLTSRQPSHLEAASSEPDTKMPPPSVAMDERTADTLPAGPDQILTAPAAPITLPQIVANVKVEGPAAIEQKGDRITTLDLNSAAFFDKGSAVLSDSGKLILKDVVTNLKSDQFKDYQITVEGHTDDTPIHTLQFPSNWELSTGRASAVVQFFLEQNISPTKLRASGYADTFPKAPNRDALGNPLPANQALNRRVVIKLEKIDKQADSNLHL